MIPHARPSSADVGIGLVALAFTLSPPAQVDPGIFWLVLGLGALAIITTPWFLFRGRGRKGGKRIATGDDEHERKLLAAESWRIAGLLADFVEDWMQTRPRARPFRDLDAQLRRWQRDGEGHYQTTFRAWGLQLFDAAVSLNGVAPESRVLVDAPSHAHLHQLPGLFRDVARSLDPDVGTTPLPA